MLLQKGHDFVKKSTVIGYMIIEYIQALESESFVDNLIET